MQELLSPSWESQLREPLDKDTQDAMQAPLLLRHRGTSKARLYSLQLMVFLVFTDRLPQWPQDVQEAGVAEISGIVTMIPKKFRGDRGTKGPACVRHYPTALSLPGH